MVIDDENIPVITSEYIDNAAIKKMVTESLIDKYFPEIDVNLRNIGMVGYVTELITNSTEDAFNTSAMLFREAFPNRAQLPESIYSHAGIYRLSDVLSKAASCKFLLLLNSEIIRENIKNGGLVDDPSDDSDNYFYISKNTVFFVEDIPFSLDYDIRITVIKKKIDNKDTYTYTANYILDDFTNSISGINYPYIKLRNSASNILAMEVQCHQCEREIIEETIMSTNDINYPVIDIEYDGQLGGFDVLYKPPGDTKYTQLQTILAYSEPSKLPFCYYQLIEENKIRITFNMVETYFSPEFNSELKVILYKTLGKDGNFEVYEGDGIDITPDEETYVYPDSGYVIAAQPITAAIGGSNEKDLETIQALTVEAYRTSDVLATENDLQLFFNNYKLRYGDTHILFIKKRDDIFEKIFSAFSLIKKDGDIYKTNTLDLLLNLYDMKQVDKSTYIIEPGTLFYSNVNDKIAHFVIDDATNTAALASYKADVAAGNAKFITPEKSIGSTNPLYKDRNCSFSEYKTRKGIATSKSVWELTKEDYATLDDPSASKFLYMNPFLIKYSTDPNLMSTYITYNNSQITLDFTDQNSDMVDFFTMFTMNMYRGFSKDKKYNISINLAPVNQVTSGNMLIKEIGKDSENNPIYNLKNKYKCKENPLRVVVVFTLNHQNYSCIELVPTEINKENFNMKFEATIKTYDNITSTNNLVLDDHRIYHNKTNDQYYKIQLIDKTKYDLYDKNDKIIEPDVSTDEVTAKVADTAVWETWQDIHPMVAGDRAIVPINGVGVKVYTLYNKRYSVINEQIEDIPVGAGVNIFKTIDPSLSSYTWTNVYTSQTDNCVFIRSLNNIRSYVEFKDFTLLDGSGAFVNDVLDMQIDSIPFMRAATVNDESKMKYFFNAFIQNYEALNDIINTRLRNQSGIDLKFYNTYGPSKEFFIGEQKEVLATVNIKLYFDMWFISGTDTVTLIPDIKKFIKDTIESLNAAGMNTLHISNMIRKLEDRFKAIDHIRFKSINNYDTTYQSINNRTEDIDDLTVEERRHYVPEMIVCDLDDIVITEYIL